MTEPRVHRRVEVAADLNARATAAAPAQEAWADTQDTTTAPRESDYLVS